MNPDKITIARQKLTQVKAAIDVALSLLADECEHPEECRKDYSTMGTIRWQCELCGFLFEQSMKEEVNDRG